MSKTGEHETVQARTVSRALDPQRTRGNLLLLAGAESGTGKSECLNHSPHAPPSSRILIAAETA